jgi:hypothetical protein
VGNLSGGFRVLGLNSSGISFRGSRIRNAMKTLKPKLILDPKERTRFEVKWIALSLSPDYRKE